jgi:hypothetical protein
MAKKRTRKPLTIKQKLAILNGIADSGSTSLQLIEQHERLSSLWGNPFVTSAKLIAEETFPTALTCLVMRRGLGGAIEETNQRIDDLLASMRRKRF